MKPIIKYISLLLFSGLILPFYNAAHTQKTVTQLNPKAIAPAIEQPKPKTKQAHIFIYQELAKLFFLELIN